MPGTDPGPVLETELMTRMYAMGGTVMRRGLVPFGEQVLVVAHPSDDRTPQRIVVVDADGEASYLKADGSFAVVPEKGHGPLDPALLRGEGIEADYADGLLALLNSDSLSDWTDSRFLDWGSQTVPTGSPVSWSTRVPLVWRESHQRTVAVLPSEVGGHSSLVVGHVGRLFKDAGGRQPVHFPSAMVSSDRGQSWTWGPAVEGVRPPAGAYAAAWPDAPGGGVILYFVMTLPSEDDMPPLALFHPDASAPSGARIEVPYASRLDLWAGHEYMSSGRSFVPTPVRHWTTRWGLVLETTTQGLFWMDRPDAKPRRIGAKKQGLNVPNRTLYFAANNELMRVLPSGDIEALVSPQSDAWSYAGHINCPAGTRWIQAAASESGALWLLGRSTSRRDVDVATWAAGQAF